MATCMLMEILPLMTPITFEFENKVVTEAVFNALAMENGAINGLGWTGYKPDRFQRTTEHIATDLKITHNISLKVREINGGARFRRRVTLPPELVQPDGVVYYFLEYKSLPNMGYREKSSIMAAREAAALAAPVEVAAQAAPPVAAQAVPQVAAQAVPQVAAQAVPPVAAQAVPQVAAQAVPHVAAEFWEVLLQDYNSSSDED